MKALCKYGFFPNLETILPWGARMTLDTGTANSDVFRVDHAIKAFSGEVICTIVPEIWHNMECRTEDLISLPHVDIVDSYTGLRITTPRCGDTILVAVGRALGEGIFLAGRASGAIFRYTGRMWKPIPYVSRKRTTQWKVKMDGKSYELGFCFGDPAQLCLQKKGDITAQFLEVEDLGALFPCLRCLPALPLKRVDFLDFVGGRKDIKLLAQIGCLRMNNLLESQHDSIETLESEAARIETVCVECADALWETRGISSSEKFVEIRKKLERKVLCKKRIEQGTKKGQLVPSVRIPSGIEER